LASGPTHAGIDASSAAGTPLSRPKGSYAIKDWDIRCRVDGHRGRAATHPSRSWPTGCRARHWGRKKLPARLWASCTPELVRCPPVGESICQAKSAAARSSPTRSASGARNKAISESQRADQHRRPAERARSYWCGSMNSSRRPTPPLPPHAHSQATLVNWPHLWWGPWLPQARNATLFGPPGRFVYRSHGIHWHFVCRESGHSAGVLIRALEPTPGLAHLRKRRGL